MNGGGSGGTTLTTGSTYQITSSYAITASYITNIPYVTIFTSSAYLITSNFNDVEEFITISIGNQTYNFTCSNLPTGNTISNLSLFIKNTSPTSNYVSFPTNWIFIGGVLFLYLLLNLLF